MAEATAALFNLSFPTPGSALVIVVSKVYSNVAPPKLPCGPCGPVGP